MAFSERTVEFLSGLREEIVRLEQDLKKLKTLQVALEDFLSDESPGTATDPSSLPPVIPPDTSLSFPPSRSLEPRPLSSGPSIGQMAIAILESEDRPFNLEELAEKIRSGLGNEVSADLKNAVRVALLRRSHRVEREKRGLYRLKKDIKSTF